MAGIVWKMVGLFEIGRYCNTVIKRHSEFDFDDKMKRLMNRLPAGETHVIAIILPGKF